MPTSLSALTALLRCPSCGQALDYTPVAQRDAAAGACGLLRCACSTYPVLDSVPVLTQQRLAHRSISDDRAVAGGPLPQDLAALVEAGQALDGLVDLLTFPACPWPLNRVGALRRLSLRGPHHTLGLAVRRRRVRHLLARRADLTAEDWLAAFYWHAPAPFDPFNYFFFRFSQPRHLATLALLATLPPSEHPLLDLACGYGHALHYVTRRPNGRALPAVGLDQNFHQVWVARHYIAPRAAFVCADASQPLPFRDGVFSAALCVDALDYVQDKAGAVAELRRAAGRGPLVLASVGNRLVGSADGAQLTPDEYAVLLADQSWRGVAEEELRTRYLAGHAPDLSASSAPAVLAASRWLYYIAAPDDALFHDHGRFEVWPHAVGQIEVNPLYEADGDRLRLRFPSPWYAEENGAMQTYAPATASRKDDREALIAQTVLAGLPERYARAQGRPWAMKANRALLGTAARLRSS